NIEIDRVAELVRLARRFGLYARRQLWSIVAAHRTLAETSEQTAQRFVTEEIQPLLSHFKFDVARQRVFKSPFTLAHHLASLFRLRFLMQLQISLFHQSLYQLIENLLELRTFVLPFVLIEHLLNLMLAQKLFVDERFQQGASQRVQRRVGRQALSRPVIIVVVTG